MNTPPPPTDPAWAQFNDKLHLASTKVANQSKAEAAKEYRKNIRIMHKLVNSCDGSWQHRGLQSINGIDTILSVNVKFWIPLCLQTIVPYVLQKERIER